MNTELLNQYMFAELLRRYALSQRQIRIKALKSESTTDDDINSIPLIQHDYDLAFEILEQSRAQALRLIATLNSDSQE